MTDRPAVSVIIPVYNTGRYLNECAASVKAQTFADWEAILVDDGSPDDAPAICDALAAEDERISVVHKTNGGLSSARNAGIEKAQGRFIIFLDSDDVLEPAALSMLIDKMTDDIDAVVSNVYTKFFESGKPEAICRHMPQSEELTDPKEHAVKTLMGKGRAWRAHSNLYRAGLIREHGVRFPEGHIAEDIVFNLRFYKYTRSIAFVDEPTLRYRKREGSITSSFDPAFLRTIDFIDGEAKAFIEDCGISDAQGYVDSLYVRNVLVYLNSMMKHKRSRSEALDMLSTARMKEAAKNYCAYPYFESGAKRAYMRMMFILQRMGLKRLSIFTAGLAVRAIK
ncbi:MAG: glycosyltransferase family 2 protein [Clostridia bacterium]|nr:glycosyltransferase family 2 protein [Clostridia bacterium]